MSDLIWILIIFITIIATGRITAWIMMIGVEKEFKALEKQSDSVIKLYKKYRELCGELEQKNYDLQEQLNDLMKGLNE